MSEAETARGPVGVPPSAARVTHTPKPLAILLVSAGCPGGRPAHEGIENSVPVHIHQATSAREALESLKGGVFGEGVRPNLILLDLDVAGGLSFLKTIKSDPQSRRIPVLALSSPDSESESLAAYENQANCCIAKPSDPSRYSEFARTIQRFWLELVELPRS